MKLPLTEEQIGWAELQLQREVSESDLEKAVNEVVNDRALMGANTRSGPVG
jgi:hypothetical protein